MLIIDNWDRIRREAIEIKLQPNNFNRDSGLHISKAWSPAISTLRRLQAHGQHSTSAPAIATLGIDHSVPDVGNAHSDWTAAGKYQQSIGDLLATISKSTAYISRAFFQLYTFFWRGPQSIKMAESLSFNNVTRQIARADILNYPTVYVIFMYNSLYYS